MLGFDSLSTLPLASAGEAPGVLTGDLTTTLDAVTGELTAALDIGGTLTSTLDPVTGELTGTLSFASTGTLTSTLGSATGELTGLLVGDVSRFTLITTSRPLVGAITTDYN